MSAGANDRKDISSLIQAVLSNYSENKTVQIANVRKIKNRLDLELDPPSPNIELQEPEGIGRLPNIPYLVAYDSRVTDTPMFGLYVAYLFDPKNEIAYLALTQGFGAERDRLRSTSLVRRVLTQRKSKIQEAILSKPNLLDSVEDYRNEAINNMPPGELETSNNELYGQITVGYIRYTSPIPPDDKLIQNFQQILDLYNVVLEEGIYGDAIYDTPTVHNITDESAKSRINAKGPNRCRVAEIRDEGGEYTRFVVYDIKKPPSKLIDPHYFGDLYVRDDIMPDEWSRGQVFDITEAPNDDRDTPGKKGVTVTATDEKDQIEVGVRRNEELEHQLTTETNKE
ncbi:MrcB family domain-containing protein [Halorubrum kocurii]|uniref:MrcB family domain-containing protein n=1 Tax=Halorubrum kocurii TaxID=478441 RepID=UPI0009B5C23E|nr:DUF3578 domain-containing protein [Halorubrum kocurii]